MRKSSVIPNANCGGLLPFQLSREFFFDTDVIYVVVIELE